MRVLVAGAGWLGTALARALAARGDRPTAVRRRAEPHPELSALGVEVLQVDLAAPVAARRLPRELDAVIACQAADGDGASAYRRAYLDANRALLDAAAAGGARAFVYTGSTGVFGQRDGEVVDEATPVSPASPSAEVLVEAEELILGSGRAGGLATRVVRLSGLYGPGRLGVVERVRSGAMALGPGDDAWTNWCHLEDAVRVVLAALDRGRPGAIHHGTDAHPATRREVVTFIAAGLGIAPATRADPGASGARGAGPNRRVSGERTRSELGLELAFPSFREGLAPHLRLAPC
jgi:nucleoside-diphosphate-sugar epimerase